MPVDDTVKKAEALAREAVDADEAQRIEDACAHNSNDVELVCVCLDCYRSAIIAAEARGQERGRERGIEEALEALKLSHYDFIDGVHTDPEGSTLYCAECAPLRALLASAASAAKPPSNQLVAAAETPEET